MKFLTTKLSDLPRIAHGFFTRTGGESEGIYGSLNCGPGSKDDPAKVALNRESVARALGIGSLVTCHQIHSAQAVVVTSPWGQEGAPQADALVTDRPGIALGILTADCAPVLFSSDDGKIVGAAHAGWKGALTGVLDATVEAMVSLGAQRGRISAAIGPCIGPQSYEVSDNFKNPFIERDAANEKFFMPAQKAGHLIFDLPGYVAHRLRQAGVNNVFDTKQDTLPNEAEYFSYRRTTLRREPDYGRQISVIAIKEDK
jgi:YfiH family protein